MDLSNWINLGLLIVSVIATGTTLGSTVVARNAQKEANEMQKRLLDVERQRDTLFDQLERTPNLSATKINLTENGRLFVTDIAITNLSRHAVHIIAIAIRNVDTNDLLAVSRKNKLVQSAEQNDVLLGAETVPVTVTDAGQGITTTQRNAVDLLSEATEISLYFRYAPTGETVYKISYQPEDIPNLTRSFHITHNRGVPFDSSKPNMTIDVEIPKHEY